ncbi:MAG TPA: hypothetical protein PLI53_04250 [Geobacteraceae bacterium]|nr:hypothetical protein [Geobacteraceae bacterium]
MSVFEKSRYEKTFVYPRRFKDMVRNTLTFREIDRAVPAGSILHTVIETDRIDNLSYQYYGTPDYWWYILDKNPGVDPLELPVGEQIWIPPAPSR